MAKTYHTIRIEEELLSFIESAEEEYRKHHKEFDGIVLTKSKILYEVLNYYLTH